MLFRDVSVVNAIQYIHLIIFHILNTAAIDDYAKDGRPGEVHEPLRTGIKKIVNKFAISNYMALILDVHPLRSNLKLTCEYELHILPNTKVSFAKDHGKNYMKVRPPLVRHL